jgi:hypothetical protein
MKTPKRTGKQQNCVECNVTYDKKTGADWIGCSVCDGWFNVDCTSLQNDVYVRMAGSDVSIWLHKVCLSNLVKYLPVSSAAFALSDMKKGFTTLCDKVDAIAVSDARHCVSLS